jgi:hypothetical protein
MYIFIGIKSTKSSTRLQLQFGITSTYPFKHIVILHYN